MVILGMVAAEDLLGRDPGVVSGMHAPHPPFKVLEAVDDGSPDAGDHSIS